MKGVEVGNRSVAEIWNSPSAQTFRASILDGSFRHCIERRCIFLSQQGVRYWEKEGSPLKKLSEIHTSRLRKIIDERSTLLEDGPLTLNCGYDQTCNLSCPSCRSEVFLPKHEEIQKATELQDRIFPEIGKNLEQLYVSGSGDPFASAVYRKLLRGLSPQAYPRLEIHLNTNGLLWTEANWEALGSIRKQVTTAHVSIDAACPETYVKNRRGGNWEILMTNLKFLSALRRKGPLRFVMLSFVVQQNNYREMPAFIELVQKFGFDLAYFHELCDWGSYSGIEYRKRAVQFRSHPEHYRFLKILSGSCFDQPMVGLHCLFRFRERALKLRKLGPGSFDFLTVVHPAIRILSAGIRLFDRVKNGYHGMIVVSRFS